MLHKLVIKRIFIDKEQSNVAELIGRVLFCAIASPLVYPIALAMLMSKIKINKNARDNDKAY